MNGMWWDENENGNDAHEKTSLVKIDVNKKKNVRKQRWIEWKRRKF